MIEIDNKQGVDGEFGQYNANSKKNKISLKSAIFVFFTLLSCGLS